MDRKSFLKKSLLVTGAALVSPHLSEKSARAASSGAGTIVGFNHLPENKPTIMKNVVFHPSDSRGFADHGWLQSRHTFSFANYYNPERMHFGALRVLNDDVVAPGMGFPAHPHRDMEIISIPLEGDLEHRDNMGNTAVIRQGDIQVMSAGTGIVHSEYNKNKDAEVRFLQIWVIPSKQNASPRYGQFSLNPADRKNRFQQIVSPDAEDEGLWINQQAWFHLADFDKDVTKQYRLKSKESGLYVFNLSGDLKVNDQVLHTRDGLGLWEIDEVQINALSSSRFLLMEVPMKF
jgi:redox-sensitive bicupin YhaK (pirin superfamily)